MTLRNSHLHIVFLCTLSAVAVSGCAGKRDAATNAPTADATPRTLSGATYRGSISPVGSDKGDPDDLVFDGKSFESVACRGFGFAASSYTESKDGDAIAFEAVVPSESGATMHWRGLARGDEITATADWSKPGEDGKQYRFVGERVR
jgi:hypothetical protein